jgi:hypothetical protein
MEVTDRVHIVAQGWEVDRVVDPIYELKADKVVFVQGSDADPLTAFEREMLEDIDDTDRLELEIRPADLTDLDSVLQAFTQAVKDHEGDDVYINVSTGTNVAGIAGMMAAQTSDATPFYVKPAFTDQDGSESVPKPEEPVIENPGEIRELPVFELRGPSPEQLRVLAYLYGCEGATKKELIAFAEGEQLPFIANTEAESDEGRYRLLETHVIDPLTDGGYVTVEKAGRKKVVHIEQRGVDALAANPLDADTLEALSDGKLGSDSESRDVSTPFSQRRPGANPTPFSERNPEANPTPFSERWPDEEDSSPSDSG